MVELDDDKIRKAVRESYGKIAEREQGYSCCGPSSSSSPTNPTSSSCCGSVETPQTYSTKLGYSVDEIQSVPQGADLGLGCGNPTALASINEGEIVIDLGSGAGFDCFLAANKTGKSGRVIGVDMTAQMIDAARENANKGNYDNVEFRLGEIENLPVPDNTADLVISNCVINLSPNKDRVFQETFRVLKPGGRIMVSDIVLTEELPENMKTMEAYAGCVAGAILKEQYIKKIENAGFKDIEIKSSAEVSFSSAKIASISVAATKRK